MRVSRFITHGSKHARTNTMIRFTTQCLTIPSQHTALGISHADALGLVGRVVWIDGEIRGYTFGYPLNVDTFCILFEVTDLKIKGLAQFIYREFCKELMDTYRWMNAMDDSGLENLKRVKNAYHPIQLIPSYNIIEPQVFYRHSTPTG